MPATYTNDYIRTDISWVSVTLDPEPPPEHLDALISAVLENVDETECGIDYLSGPATGKVQAGESLYSYIVWADCYETNANYEGTWTTKTGTPLFQ